MTPLEKARPLPAERSTKSAGGAVALHDFFIRRTMRNTCGRMRTWQMVQMPSLASAMPMPFRRFDTSSLLVSTEGVSVATNVARSAQSRECSARLHAPARSPSSHRRPLLSIASQFRVSSLSSRAIVGFHHAFGACGLHAHESHSARSSSHAESREIPVGFRRPLTGPCISTVDPAAIK